MASPVRLHPHRLHATAALLSLNAARLDLHQRLASLAVTTAAGSIQAWRPMVGRSRGGHGDGVASALFSDAGGPDPWAEHATRVAADVTATLRWLARGLALPADADPLPGLLSAVPGLRDATAGHVWRWVRDADASARRALPLPRDLHPVHGNPACPSCGTQLLRVQTHGPNPGAWTVTCERPGCVCSGAGCRCTMAVPVAGVPHIWPAVRWVPAQWLRVAARWRR